MPTALPPINQDQWDQHVQGQTDQAVSDGFAALDSARQAQDQARQAEQIATAREQEESNRSAQAQLNAVLQPARDAQATAIGTQQARDQLDSILAPARAAQQQAQQATNGPFGPSAEGVRTPSAGLEPSGPTDVQGTDWRAYAAQAAQTAGIDPALFQRQIQQESGFDPNARSGAGAQGIAQIVPSAHPGVDPMNPKAALDYAATWMRQLTDRYGGDVRKALAAYNAGPGAVDRYGGVPPFEETQRYVRTIYDEPQASPLEPPTTPGQEKAQYATARAPGRVEAVGQFEQGLPYEEAAAICGPVAALAFAQANGRNPSLAEVRALARQRGWTSTGGMNGIANEQATLTDLGVKSRLDPNPDFGHIAQDAQNGNPVIISTPVHYYFASDFDPNTGKVFVGKTGTSRKGGGSWMTPQEIATLDGGINGALFVDNPQSPTPSVGADPMAAGPEGDRPASEFETSPPQEIPRRLGPDQIAPTDLSRIGIDVPVPGPSEVRAAARRGAETVGAGIDWAGAGLVDNVQKFTADQEELARLSLDRARAAHRGETLPPDQEERLTELSMSYGLPMTGEPLAAVNQAGRAALGLERAAASRQPGMSLETTGGPGGPVERLQSAVDAAVGGAAGQVERLGLEKFPEAVRATIQEAAGRGDFWQQQRRNVIPDAEAERMAAELDRTVEQMVAGGRSGRAYNTEETRALRNALTGQAIRVDDLRATVDALGDKASDAARRSLGEEESRLLALSRVAEGARAEAGRSFRAYLADTQGRLARARQPEYTNLSRVPIEAAPPLGEGAAVPTAARPQALSGMADVPVGTRQVNLLGKPIAPPPGAAGPSLYDRFQTVRFAGMLSSTATQILNNTANAVNTLADIGLKPLQVALDAATTRATGGERTRYLAEVAPQAKAFVAGMITGAKKAPHILATGVDPETAGALDLPRGGLRSGSKAVDAVVEAPLRLLSAADAMWRGAAYAGHAAALATRQAVREGLSGAERAARVDHILSNLHEFKSIGDEASKLAARSVFQERRAELDPALALLKGTKARYLTDVVLPFVRTPYNVAAQGVGMTPVGFAGAIRAAKAGQRGEAIDRAVRAAVGTAAMGYGMSLAASGYITGATPDDAAERSTLPDGWKPYSLRIPVEDGAVYVPLQMLGPVAMPLGIAGALGDLTKRAQAGADPQKLAYRGVSVLAKYVGDQAFLQGLSALPNIIDEPERYLETFLEGYASSVMPASAFQKQIDQFLGRAPRDPKGALEGFLAASPLTSQVVGARRNALGDERRVVSGPAALVTGTRITAEHDDPSLAVLRREGVGVPADPKDIDGVPLSADEQATFRTIAGERVRAAVARVDANPRVAQLSPSVRAEVYKSAVEGAREQARGLLLKQIGAAAFRERRSAAPVGRR